ncbi:MAG: hypothetical protein K0Q72_2141 [Armatimonadetes bacterium]|jgi:hypothetical protein|nr:hypothetical protein [Armatimonadota bacterium]
MRLDYTRQTRWGHDPEVVDPDELPAGGIYVKQVVWVPCNECDLQVHAALTQFFGGGLTCPECGGRLTSPRVLGNPDVAMARIAEIEDILRESVEPGTPFIPEE